MASDKAPGNQPANSGDGNANKGPNRNNRRRSLRSKRRGRKPEEGSEPRETRENREPRSQAAAPKVVEKNVRDNRERRRRRRMRSKQRGPTETVAPVADDALKDLPPLIPAFVYTHVLRPAVRDSFEFRSEHFSKVTRKMEDFHIDLSPLYPDGGDEIKGVAYMPPLPEGERLGGGDDEEYDDDWEEETGPDAAHDVEAAHTEIAHTEAAHTEIVIADDFYEDLNDSVLDDSPEEDIDA